MRRTEVSAASRESGGTWRGVTLPELLIAMVIMTLIMGTIATTYYTASHVWRRCSSQSQAEPPAHMSVSRVNSDLRNAYRVDHIGSSTITFTLPRQGADGVNILPLQPASRVSYYVSDDSGDPSASGSRLWRERTDLTGGGVVRSCIAENVESLSFECDATEDRVLKIYAMSVTILGREGHEEYRSRFGSHVAFRN